MTAIPTGGSPYQKIRKGSAIEAPTILVTGANGFVGRHVCDYFRTYGHPVRGLVRDISRYPFRESGIRLFACDLPTQIDTSAFVDAEVLIHCAYMTRHTCLADARRVNELGTQRIYQLSRDYKIRHFVFISSIGADEEAPSYYGRSKLVIERMLDEKRDLIIRPGLVLGPGEGGLFNRLVSSLRHIRVVPIFDGGRQIVHTVYVGDLCAALYNAVARALPGRYVVAESAGLTLRELFRLVAQKMGKRCIFVPVPARPLVLALRFLERMRIPLPISSENILGIIGLRTRLLMDVVPELGVIPMTAAESLEMIFSETQNSLIHHVGTPSCFSR